MKFLREWSIIVINFKLLYLTGVNYDNISRLFDLIKINKHLEYFSVTNSFPCTSSLILRSLGQILPNSLKYLDLSLVIDPTDLRIFFNNCKHVTGLNKLLIKDGNTQDIAITFDIFEEFVRKEKIKHFTYKVEFHYDVNLANIGMERYTDLVVNISDFNI